MRTTYRISLSWGCWAVDRGVVNMAHRASTLLVRRSCTLPHLGFGRGGGLGVGELLVYS